MTKGTLYNLLIVGADGYWHDNRLTDFEISRFGEWSDKDALYEVEDRFAGSKDFPYDLGKITSLPTLLAYEERTSRIGMWANITQLKVFGNKLRFKFHFQENTSIIEDLYKDEVAFDLGIDPDSFEVSRTHWAIKYGQVRKYIDYIGPELIQEPQGPDNKPQTATRDVFIVHGHDDAAVHEVARVIASLDFNPVILREQPDRGQTIIQKFERHAATCTFAVVLLTPDDNGGRIGGEMNLRARQNVILELGYFVGSLGREKVLPLKKGDIEIPNDILGVLWTELDVNGGWRLKLAREMKQAGLPVDLNRLD